MAKGQKRSNKEIRKPKAGAGKPAAVAAPSGLSRGQLTPVSMPKKKG